MATDTEYAWAAGFIEADGCIHLSRIGQMKVEVIVVQKDIRPLLRLQAIFEDTSTIGLVKRRAGTAQYYRLVFGCRRAKSVLTRILPYLGHKRAIALLGIQLDDRISAWRGRSQPFAQRRVPEHEMQQRRQIVQQARDIAGDAERLSEEAPAYAAG
jgi:hypothetical protein